MAADLKKAYQEVLPFAAVVALSRTAVVARDAVRAEEKRVFKSPTPYATNAPRAVTATKDTMSSAVILRDSGSVPAGNYLGPEIEAGARHVKRFEMALRYRGILQTGQFVVPATHNSAAEFDRYGNLSERQIEDVLGALHAYTPGTALAKRIIKSSNRRVLARHARPAVRYYVARSHLTKKPLGIWKVVSRGVVKPVMIFVRQPVYHERLDFYGVARTSAEAAFGVQLDKSLTEFAEK